MVKPTVQKTSAGLSIIFSVLIFFLGVNAQSAFTSGGYEERAQLSRLEIMSGKISDQAHLSVTPLQTRFLVSFVDSAGNDYGDSVNHRNYSGVDLKNAEFFLTDNDEWSQFTGAQSAHPILKYFYRDKATLYQHRNNDFLLKINPVFDFEAGKESASNQTLFTNSRGINVQGWIAKKVGYNFFLTENQARYPLFVRQRIDSFGAIPGEGYFKTFKTDGVDFFNVKGYFDFTAAKFITIQFGHDQNFLGNGIRSLELSDFSGSYLFLKLQTQVWKIQYQNIFMDITGDFLRGGDQLLPKKYAAIHHLSINASKFLNAGVFESVVFHRNNGFELQYLNPVIFYRSVEQLIGSPDNSILGVDYRVNFLRHLQYYGQAILDDYNVGVSKGASGYWGNKYGFQQGVKYINAFTLSNLDLQLEWNHVRPYTYTHDDSVANYSNYNQPLAHPLGANFNEIIAAVHYQPVFSLTIESQLMVAVQGRDTMNSNWGANIFIPTTAANVENIYGNEVAQGVRTHLLNFQLSVSWMLKHNLFADVIYKYRDTRSDDAAFRSSSSIFQIGIRMNIDRKRFEF